VRRQSATTSWNSVWVLIGCPWCHMEKNVRSATSEQNLAISRIGVGI